MPPEEQLNSQVPASESPAEITLPPELDNIDGMSDDSPPEELDEGGGETPESPAGEPTPEAEPAAAASTPPPTSPDEQPPDTWTKEAKAEWAKVPPAVRSELIKREADYRKGIAEYKVPAEVGQAFEKVITPFLPVYQKYNVNPWQHIPALLNAHAVLTWGPPEHRIAVARQLVQDAGLDLSKLNEGGDAAARSEIAQLRQQVQQLTANVTGVTGKLTEAELTKLEGEVQAFAADTVNNPYFFDVAAQMQQFLTTDPKMTLRRAYDLAVLDNPITREKELQRQIGARRKAEEEAAAAKVKGARKAASTNVVSRGQGRGAASQASERWEDTLAESLQEIKSRDQSTH